MRKDLLIKIIRTFKETTKAIFLVEVFNRDKHYKFRINKDCIQLQVDDKFTGINELDLMNPDLESVLPNTDFRIKCITEEMYTLRNELYRSSYYNCLDDTQVYLPLFRVLGDQVVCLIKNNTGKLLKMFFINGRAFIINKIEDTLHIEQTDLRKVFVNSEIVSFERLNRRYNYASVYSTAESYAKENGLKVAVKKLGMSCQQK